MEGGPPQGNQEGAWRGPSLGRARGPPGCPVGPLPWAGPGAPSAARGGPPPPPPFTYIYPPGQKPREPFFVKPSLFRRRRRFNIGASWRSCSATLPEGDTPSGRPSIAMDASRMCREYSPLDHGSVISSYVMNLSPLCASTFESS